MQPQNKDSRKSIFANHTVVLAVILLLAGGLYLVFSNTTMVLASGIFLLIAHLAVITGIGLLLRNRLARGFRKLWQAHTNQNNQ